MAFSFWEYHFFFLEIFNGFCLTNEESDDIIGGSTNTEYLQKYWSSVIQTWHHKHTSQKKYNDTYYVVAMTTLSAPVSFCEKPNIPICNLLKWDRGSSSAHKWIPIIALTITIRLLTLNSLNSVITTYIHTYFIRFSKKKGFSKPITI